MKKISLLLVLIGAGLALGCNFGLINQSLADRYYYATAIGALFLFLVPIAYALELKDRDDSFFPNMMIILVTFASIPGVILCMTWKPANENWVSFFANYFSVIYVLSGILWMVYFSFEEASHDPKEDPRDQIYL